MRAPRTTDDQLRRLRSAAQLLHRPKRLSALELVRHLAGVQAQVVSAATLALRARAEGVTRADVDRARLEERSLLLTWAMRGTLHLVAAEDAGWLVPRLLERVVPNAYRRLAREGMPADQPEVALKLIQRTLDQEGPLSRRELAARLEARGIETRGQVMPHLLWLAAARGAVCHGPERGGEQCFVLTRDWLGPLRPREREAGLAELAVRYLRAHQPALPEDLASWSGIRLGEARQAWRSIEDRLASVETPSGTLWRLRSRAETAPAGLLRLVPAFDEYLLGWKDRGLLASAESWSQVNRGGGWLHPVVLVDGRVTATWRAVNAAGGLRIEIRELTALPPESAAQLQAEVEEVREFLASPAPLPGSA